MSNYILTSDGELYHYGIKGQKWGVRRYQNADGSLKPAGKKRYQAEKEEYKQSKQALKTAEKAQRKALRRAVGAKGLLKLADAEKNVQSAELGVIDAKAKYKAAKSKNPEKAEFNTYKREMGKSGLVNSYADSQSGGRSTRIYTHLKATKGKAYADKVQRKIQNEAVSTLVGTTFVAAGTAAALLILENRK